MQVGMGPGVLLQMTCVVLPLAREFKKVDQFDAYVPCAFEGHQKSFPHEPQSKVSFYIYMSLLTICRGFLWVYKYKYIDVHIDVPCAFEGHQKSSPHEPQSKVFSYICIVLLKYTGFSMGI